MKKPKNKNGTWNVYDFHEGDNEDIGWRTVPDSWLNEIPRKGIVKLEYHSNNTLKVVYYSTEYGNNKEVWYQNVHGTWGFPTVFR